MAVCRTGRLRSGANNIRSLASANACRANADLASELIAPPGDGADQLAVGAKGFAQRSDLAGEPALFDNPVRPDALQHVVFIDDRSLGLDQRH